MNLPPNDWEAYRGAPLGPAPSTLLVVSFLLLLSLVVFAAYLERLVAADEVRLQATKVVGECDPSPSGTKP